MKTILLILLATATLGAGPLTDASRSVFYAGAGFDFGTTAYAIHNDPNLYESNPLLRNRNATPIVAIGFGLTALTDFALVKVRMPRAAAVIRFAVGGFHVGVGIHNIKIGERR